MGQGLFPLKRTNGCLEGRGGHAARLQLGKGGWVCTGYFRGRGRRRETRMGEGLPGVAFIGRNAEGNSTEGDSGYL